MRVHLLPYLAFCLSFCFSAAFVVPKKSLHETSFRKSRELQHVPTADGTSLKAFPDVIQTATAATESITSSPLFSYFIQTVISCSVPAFFTVVTIGFAASTFRKKKGNDDSMDDNTAITELYSDLYGDSRKEGRGGFPFQKPSKSKLRNLGIPSTEYLKITSLNEKFDSYDFSVAKATKSKAFAASKFRSKSFDRALQLALTGDKELPAYAKSQLLEAEKTFLLTGTRIVSRIQGIEGRLASEAIDFQLKRMGVENFEMDPKPLDAVIESKNNVTLSKNETNAVSHSPKQDMKKSGLLKEVSKLQRQLKQLELEFIQDVIAAVGSERAVGVRAAFLGDFAARGTGGLLTQLEGRPLSSLLQSWGSAEEKKSLFVMDFPGDVTASQLNGLREEVTAIVRNAKPGDEALVILQSGGGTVTGYGLAAGQLVRLKEKGMYLTIAVEQVAASGGYMMSCVADRIVASPFAVLGSIGVISEIPNFYGRLKDEGIEFQTVTAGKFKRGLTPTKKVTKEDIDKAKGDVEGILVQFANFVKQNRPGLDVDAVATGETWFGQAALERGLCDEIKPVDDVLLNYVDLGYNVYEVDYSPPPQVPDSLFGLLPVGQAKSSENGFGRKIIRWFVETVAAEVRSVTGASDSVEKRYMARDDTADRVKVRDE